MLPKLLISNSTNEIRKVIDSVIANFKVSTFDIIKIGEDGSTIKIEAIRELRNKLNLKPGQGNYQMIVIYNSQNLTPEAQNALLKTLEEPPDHAIIILSTSNENLLLPTVVSRCEIVRLVIPGVSQRFASETSNSVATTRDPGLDPRLRGDDRSDRIRVNQLEIRVNRIMQMDIGERFKLAEELTKKQDKDEPLEEVRKRVEQWLQKQTALMMHIIIAEKNQKSEIEIHNLKALINCQKQIRQNLNMRLVLENCFLNLV